MSDLVAKRKVLEQALDEIIKIHLISMLVPHIVSRSRLVSCETRYGDSEYQRTTPERLKLPQ
jgi:hypothetical protein